MPTTKKRLNITLSDEMDLALSRLARHDRVPQATKASSLLKMAIETEEDEVWDKIASERDVSNAEYVSHKKAWGI